MCDWIPCEKGMPDTSVPVQVTYLRYHDKEPIADSFAILEENNRWYWWDEGEEAGEVKVEIAAWRYIVPYDGDKRSNYEKGMNDAWNLAWQILDMNQGELLQCFKRPDLNGVQGYFSCVSAMEAKEKIEAWESNRVNYGDILVDKSSSGRKCVVLNIENGSSEFLGLFGNGIVSYEHLKFYEKTGKNIKDNINEIISLIK